MLNKLNHIALILDGNKRWAKRNNQSNLQGYTKGFENIQNFSLNLLTSSFFLNSLKIKISGDNKKIKLIKNL